MKKIKWGVIWGHSRLYIINSEYLCSRTYHYALYIFQIVLRLICLIYTFNGLFILVAHIDLQLFKVLNYKIDGYCTLFFVKSLWSASSSVVVIPNDYSIENNEYNSRKLSWHFLFNWAKIYGMYFVFGFFYELNGFHHFPTELLLRVSKFV